MFVTNYDITIGDYRVQMLDSVTVNKSVENLANTAVIVIPGTHINAALYIEDKVNVGDAVTVRFGYDNAGDELQTEFTGYLNSIATDDAAIKLECMDALYIFKKTAVKNNEYKSVSVKTLLNDVVKQAGNIKIVCDYDFTYEKFTFYKATAFDVLKKIQEEIKANIYLDGDMLHIHPPYAHVANEKAIIFDFARNIESSDLKYVKAADKQIEVEVSATKADGKKMTVKVGNTGGATISRTVNAADEGSMKNAAQSEYNLWVYDGYEGGFTGWLVPYVEPACKVELRDNNYRDKNGMCYKNGVYYVIGTETNFSASGGTRKVILGRKLG